MRATQSVLDKVAWPMCTGSCIAGQTRQTAATAVSCLLGESMKDVHTLSSCSPWSIIPMTPMGLALRKAIGATGSCAAAQLWNLFCMIYSLRNKSTAPACELCGAKSKGGIFVFVSETLQARRIIIPDISTLLHGSDPIFCIWTRIGYLHDHQDVQWVIVLAQGLRNEAVVVGVHNATI